MAAAAALDRVSHCQGMAAVFMGRRSHRVHCPVENLHGRAVLRVMEAP
jgi:hypothetical protein